MTLVMPNVGEVLAINALTGKTAASTPWVLKLFSDNQTPANSDVASDYTEVAGGGYASINLTAANWGTTGGSPTVSLYAPAQTFTFTGATDAPGTIYGYFIVDAGGVLVIAERLPSPPFTPASNGDSITITPRITLASVSGD